MKHTLRFTSFVLLAGLILLASPMPPASALGSPNPQSGSTGLQGTISSPPPQTAATITTPVSGQTFTTMPITINGICPKGLLVKVFSNNIFIGSVQCDSGSYSLQADLFSGQNDLVVRVYDAFDQPGPDSNIVHVVFSDAQFAAFGGRVMLSSNYAKRGANPGAVLSWPVILSGGNGPYAVSIDWGDSKPASLMSVSFPGSFNITHTYDSAGIYRVVVKASDGSGTTAYLQLVGVANGAISQAAATAGGPCNTIVKTKVLWWPSAVALLLIVLAFWIGRRYELAALRRRIEQSTNSEFQG